MSTAEYFFSQILRNKISNYLQAVRKGNKRDLETIEQGILLILEALLEM